MDHALGAIHSADCNTYRQRLSRVSPSTVHKGALTKTKSPVGVSRAVCVGFCQAYLRGKW